MELHDRIMISTGSFYSVLIIFFSYFCIIMAAKIGFEEFVERATKIHGGKYSYSREDFDNPNSEGKLRFVCPRHGEFWQTKKNHLKGYGCSKCGREDMNKPTKKTTEQFIGEAKAVWGNRLIFDKVEYRSAHEKVVVICPEHGEFMAEPNEILRGHGCPTCGNIRNSMRLRLTQDEFMEKARKIHGDTYDLSRAVYVKTDEKIIVGCRKHGWFEITPNSFLSGQGCRKCGFERTSKALSVSKEEFFDRCMDVHNNKYTYVESTFTGMSDKMKVICPIHGEFEQNARTHMLGYGCPKCGHNLSKSENEIYDFIVGKLGEGKVISRDREEIKPLELDIYIPSLKVAVEYNGLIWHSNKFSDDKTRQFRKTQICEKKGIRLIQVFEDEYMSNRQLVLDKIAHIIGVDQDKPRIMARKCHVYEIQYTIAKEFLEKNHIQGFAKSSIHLGCYYADQLIGVMSFRKERNDGKKWELTRFATDNRYICNGVGGKLFKYFTRNYEFDEIKSFADRRWSVDQPTNLYRSLGFELDGYTHPEYRYIVKNEAVRIHKFNFRKQTLHRKYGLPLTMTEREMTEAIGAYRVYDCGLIRYIFRRN